MDFRLFFCLILNLFFGMCTTMSVPTGDTSSSPYITTTTELSEAEADVVSNSPAEEMVVEEVVVTEVSNTLDLLDESTETSTIINEDIDDEVGMTTIKSQIDPQMSNQSQSQSPNQNQSQELHLENPEMYSESEDHTPVVIKATIERKSQEEVLAELENLWYIQEGLDDQNSLKESLSSLVHLSYARVYTEPDVTLYRLKHLLRQLRLRLNQKERDEEPRKNPNHRYHSRRKRNIGTNTNINLQDAKGNDDIENLILTASDINKIDFENQNQNHDIPPHNARIGDKTSENGIDSTNLENSEKSHRDYYTYTYDVKPTGFDDAIVQKVIRVRDKLYYPLNLKKKVTTTTPLPLPLPVVVEPEILYLVKKPGQNSEDLSQLKFEEIKKEPTPEQIANTIVKLLYPAIMNISQGINPNFDYLTGPSAPSSESGSLEDIKKVEIDINPTRYEYDPPFKIHFTQPSIATSTSTTPKSIVIPYPSYIKFIGVDGNSIELPYLAQTASTKRPKRKKPTQTMTTTTESNDKIDPGTEIYYDDYEINIVTKKPRVKSPLLQIIDDLASSDITKSASAILNGTSDGIANFINSYNRLTFSAKLVLLFAISTSVLCIVLGIYSFAPPITAVGILGILIPIILLFLFQNPSYRAGNNQQGKRNEESRIIDDLANSIDEIVRTVDLINGAFKKYNSELNE